MTASLLAHAFAPLPIGRELPRARSPQENLNESHMRVGRGVTERAEERGVLGEGAIKHVIRMYRNLLWLISHFCVRVPSHLEKRGVLSLHHAFASRDLHLVFACRGPGVHCKSSWAHLGSTTTKLRAASCLAVVCLARTTCAYSERLVSWLSR